MAAMMMAWRGFMARVDTTVAMALGASVAPLTMITPTLSRVTTARTGFDTSSERKRVHSMVTEVLPRGRPPGGQNGSLRKHIKFT